VSCIAYILTFYYGHGRRPTAKIVLHAGAVGSFVCGSCAGVAYWVSIYPLDSVKSRVQVLSAQGKVAGLWRTFWNILTTEGETVLRWSFLLCDANAKCGIQSISRYFLNCIDGVL